MPLRYRFLDEDRLQRQASQIDLGGGGSGGANSPGINTWTAGDIRTYAVCSDDEDHATDWAAGHSTLSIFAVGIGPFAGLPRSPSSIRRRLSAAQHIWQGSRPLKMLSAACTKPRSTVRDISIPPQATTWTPVDGPVAKVSAKIMMPT